MDKNLQKKIKELEKAGYKVKKTVPSIKKTFDVSEEQLERFLKLVAHKDLKIKVALAEAIEDWIKKNS